MDLNGVVAHPAHFCMAFFSFIYCLILNTVGTGQRRGKVPVFSYYFFYPNEQRTLIGFFR